MFEHLKRIKNLLDAAQIPHALIGGLALAAHGVQRMTNDLDFMIEESLITKLKTTLSTLGYTVFHESLDIIQFHGEIPIDVLIARRPIAKELLQNAPISEVLEIRCVSVEGLIALKVQAYTNNPKRELQDKADIQALFLKNPNIDLVQLKSYVDLFDEWDEVLRIRSLND